MFTCILFNLNVYLPKFTMLKHIFLLVCIIMTPLLRKISRIVCCCRLQRCDIEKLERGRQQESLGETEGSKTVRRSSRRHGRQRYWGKVEKRQWKRSRGTHAVIIEPLLPKLIFFCGRKKEMSLLFIYCNFQFYFPHGQVCPN